MGIYKASFRRVVCLLIACLLFCVVVSCVDKGSDDILESVARHKRLAGELRDNRLYSAAIEEYQKILDNEELDNKMRANINYLVAKIYYENLENYEKAAAYYVRARALDPEGSFIEEASRKLVESLEKMGHMLDAKRQLTSITDIDTVSRVKGDVVVARVGGVPVWLSEIEEQIQALPPDAQKQFLNREAKRQFVHNYVATELLYHAAIREDYGSDPEIKRQQRLLYKKLLVDKYVVDKVMPQIHIDTADVRNYYLAHKEKRYNNAPYDSVKASVFLDYQGEKAEAAFSDYISRLARIEKVEFLDHNVR